MGGLGNQMFQYAAARHLAYLHKTELRIDGSNFSRLTPNQEHTQQLTFFNLSAHQASNAEIRQVIEPAQPLLRMIMCIAGLMGRPAFKWKSPNIYKEPASNRFKLDILELGHDTYLLGHFNSYKYFAPIRNELLEEYTPREALSPAAQDILRQIEASNSVSIHIRRGDYVEDPGVYKGINGIITDRYYRNAIEHIASIITSPHFFVFSNDMLWVKKNFKIPHEVTYVDFNLPQRGFEDLWLMSRCKHNITAGASTFSWWAAYLNTNEKKIVVRTQNVNNDPEFNHPEDYFPPEWVSVKP